MKRFKILSVILIVFIFLNGLSFSVFAAEKLPAPTNLYWNGTVATWDEVENAYAYKVEIYKDNIYKGSNTNHLLKTTADFANLIAENGEGEYKFRVITLGDGVNYTDSDPSPLSNIYGIIGDANLDGVVTIKDVTGIQLHLAEIETLSAKQISLADANNDGDVDVSDATEIQRYLAYYIDRLG